MENTENNSGIIYKVINTKTDQVYIGTTTKSIDERKNDHLQKSNKGTRVNRQQKVY